MQLLVVDDDPSIRRMLLTILRHDKYDILEAENGEVAWKLLQEQPIPLLIVDWMMPLMNGTELIQHIRKASFPHYTYILLLTARGNQEDIVEGLEAGADDYLTKSLGPQELRLRVAIGRRIIEGEQRLQRERDHLAQVLAERSEMLEVLARQSEQASFLQQIAIAANEALSARVALQAAVQLIGEYMRWPVGHIYVLNEQGNSLISARLWHLDDPTRFASFRVGSELIRFRRGAALPGQVWEQGQPLWINDVTQNTSFVRAALARQLGLHAVLAFPILSGKEVVAVMEFFTEQSLEPDEALLEVMAQVGTQLGRVIEREQAGGALARQAEELARSNAELGQFASVASHDLQEPLRMITSYLQLLERRYGTSLDPKAQEFIAQAVGGATRMQELIHDLLTYARVGSSQEVLRQTELAALLEQVLTNLQVAIQESGAVITHDPLPSLDVYPTQIVSLLQNLIANAIKFRAQRPPRIHLHAHHQAGHWTFALQDNGIGFEAQHADRIFAIFRRLHTQQEYPGTGIGLAICKRVVERHQGRIWVESILGEGTTFYFTLWEGGQGHEGTTEALHSAG